VEAVRLFGAIVEKLEMLQKRLPAELTLSVASQKSFDTVPIETFVTYFLF
jgi:hypothetical protein